MNWISVNDRRPAKLESVIAWGRLDGDEEHGSHEAFIDADSGEFDSVRHFTFIADVTHWMPMPDGPNSEKSPFEKPNTNARSGMGLPKR